ncbi:bifunctional 3-(3-hydroxy-phenyl)propionate/3-hydroxycinnamic acid hydroxylase [Paraburkholderia tropica]|uniref:bifunctional 3-(3-hydroxy-phenyl)propionate/3-hydroxycinnamic acid hydroxylase n=1 Tax=Paraburkholderia tropica TaxID=92647 RepID=UPI002AB197A7|nr:bifunctional 3-(3-hydroxy-phenyl)propionate/3-hydroxycinnamic acid hydroxylase [Paraburkholderia tropica]
METYDAIIAGYGPTGATLANLLGNMGMKVAVVEREKAIFDKPRAITADHEAMRAFQAAGLAEQIAATTRPHPGTDFVGVNGDVIKRFYPMPVPGPLGWEPSFMFYQPELERILRDGVKRFDVDVFLEHCVQSYHQEDNLVEVTVVGPSHSNQVLRGRSLLACDGARSAVRTQMNAPIHDLAFDEWWVVVDAHLHRDIDLPERCVQYCRPSRPGTYIVGPEQLRRWEIKVLPGEAPELFNEAEHLDRVLSSFVDTSALEVQRVAIYRFHAVVVEKWRDGNVFLLGDAAHQMPPFMGQGLCAGVRDAYNLAWKLHAVLQGEADASLLDTYAEERRPHVQSVVEHAKSFGLVIGELNPEAALERDRRLSADLASGKATTVRQDFIPGLSAGLLYKQEDGELGIASGRLFPQPWLSSDNLPRTRLDDLVRGRFHVVCSGKALAVEARKLMDAAPRLTGGQVICLGDDEIAHQGIIACEEEDALVRQWMASYGVLAAIVRPDGFAYGGARDLGELAKMIDALGMLLNQPAAKSADARPYPATASLA